MKQYSPEFKAQLIKEVEETGNARMVGRRHGVASGTLHGWIKKKKAPKKGKDTKELKKPHRELEEKERENEILKELLKKTNVAWLGDWKSHDDSSKNGDGK